MSQQTEVIRGIGRDTLVYRSPTQRHFGGGEYVFGNGYSILGWGYGAGGRPMPDDIPGKGVAQCLTGAYFFEKAAGKGIPTIYEGLVDPRSDSILPKGQPVPTNRMDIKVARVLKPEHMEDAAAGVPSYREYSQDPRPGCAVVPVDFIFRFGLPPGSSAFWRMREGEAKPEDFRLGGVPSRERPFWFGTPSIDYRTKLDPRGELYDLGREWYRGSAGIEDEKMTRMESFSKAVAQMMGEEYDKIGMRLWDGRLGFVFGRYESNSLRTIYLGDVPGELDSTRVTPVDHPERHMSKQFLVDVYGMKQPGWVAACREESRRGGRWQERVLGRGLAPEHLTDGERDLASAIYTSAANALWRRSIISDAPSLEEVGREYREFLRAAGKE